MNCDKIGNCDQCPRWFDEGKDFCKCCGFDLNSYNKPEEEEDETLRGGGFLLSLDPETFDRNGFGGDGGLEGAAGGGGNGSSWLSFPPSPSPPPFRGGGENGSGSSPAPPKSGGTNGASSLIDV